MFPALVNVTNLAPVPTALVATPLPDSIALRVPIDTTPPPVSSAQIYNNARGNGSYTPSKSAAELSVPVSAPANISPPIVSSASPTNIPATFLAQLIAQNVPVELQSTLSGVLVQYEKMLNNSLVKFGNSYASLPPPPQPSNSFGALLQKEKSAPVTEPTAALARQQPAQPATPVPAPTVQDAPVPARPTYVVREEKRETPKAFTASAASAYKATAERADIFVKETARKVA
jgi:hypothetical protein